MQTKNEESKNGNGDREYRIKPSKILYQSVDKDQIEVEMDIREYKQKKKNAHKIRFDSTMEFILLADTKKNKAKNFHYCIFEDVPVTNSAALVPKHKKELITSYMKSILDQ